MIPRKSVIDVSKLFDREAPHSPYAEMSLLGSLILDPAAHDEIADVLAGPSDFYMAGHAAIYTAMKAMRDSGQDFDPAGLADRLRDGGTLEPLGGEDYLVRLVEGVASPAGAVHHARVVAAKAGLRRLAEACGGIIHEAYSHGGVGHEDMRAILDRAETTIFSVARSMTNKEAQSTSELMDLEIIAMEKQEGGTPRGLPTGFSILDDVTGGFQPGEMIVIAARPSMGKSALATTLVEQIAFGGHKVSPAIIPTVGVALFSLEMNKSSLCRRMLSAASGVDSIRLRNATMTQDEHRLCLHAAAKLSEAQIFIDDSPGMTVYQFRSKARRLVAQHGVKIVFVDYLQLLTAPDAGGESRQVEVSEISRQIKALARELDVPIVCLSQLNRSNEARENKRPRMSDLRESGSIEQDADVVMLLHREGYYQQDTGGSAMGNNDAELIIAKQRNGPTETIHLVWEPQTTRFLDLPGGRRAA